MGEKKWRGMLMKITRLFLMVFWVSLVVISAGCKKDKENEEKEGSSTDSVKVIAAAKETTGAEISINNGSVAEGDEGSSNLKLTVACSSNPRKNRDVTVKWSTSDATGTSEPQATAGEDYIPSSGVLTFTKGGSLQQQIIVPVKSDIDVEENEIFIVTLDQPVNATIANGVGEALIVNDDSETPPDPDPEPAGDKYMLISKERLESLPTSGAEWDYLKKNADEAVAVTLDSSSEGSPWLTNFNDTGDGQRLPAKYLGAALVYASAYSGDKEPYRKAVEDGIRHIIGSEEELGTDGTEPEEGYLAVARQLTAWIMAADLIDFDRSLTGTRTTPGRTSGSDWTKVSFEGWLSTITEKEISNHSRWRTIAGTQEDSASNFAAHSTAARVAVCLYLKDTEQLAKTIKVMKGFLGDNASYPTYPLSQEWPYPNDGMTPSGAFDPTWACNYSDTKNGWRPINSGDCGPEMDGIMVDDISRSAGSYPNWDNKGISYSHGALQGLYLAAVLLERAGEPAFSWSDQALKRAILWLDRQGQVPSTNDLENHYGHERHLPWIANYYYNLNLTTQPSHLGRSLAFTDWLFPKP